MSMTHRSAPVPDELFAKAQAARPGLNPSALIRTALAHLAGVPADQYPVIHGGARPNAGRPKSTGSQTVA